MIGGNIQINEIIAIFDGILRKTVDFTERESRPFRSVHHRRALMIIILRCIDSSRIGDLMRL